MDDGTGIGLAVIQGWMVWALTAGVKRLLPKGDLEKRIRPWLPEISILLSVGLVAAWQALEGASVVSFESLRLAAAAAGTAIMSHSVMREKVKMMKGTTPPSPPDALLVFVCAFAAGWLMMGM
jgi:hypothetical protein